MKGRTVAKAPNYTSAALVMGFVNLLWMLGVVLVAFGFPALLLTALALNMLLARWERSYQR